jgi:hypothetical protein
MAGDKWTEGDNVGHGLVFLCYVRIRG